MPTPRNKSTWRHIRRAVIVVVVTATTLLLSACGNTGTTAQQQEIVVPVDENGDRIGTDAVTVQDQAAPGTSSQSNPAGIVIHDGSASAQDGPIAAVPPGESGSTTGSTALTQCESIEVSVIEIIQSGMAGAASKTSDASQDCDEALQLSDGQKGTVTSITAPTGAASMTEEEIQMFLDLPEVKAGIILVPTAQP